SSQEQDSAPGLMTTRYLPEPDCEGTDHAPSSKVTRIRAAISIPLSSRMSMPAIPRWLCDLVCCSNIVASLLPQTLSAQLNYINVVVTSLSMAGKTKSP